VLSGFKPVEALKSKMTTTSVAGLSLRRSLVVVQFVISQVLVIGTLVAINQMQYLRMHRWASTRMPSLRCRCPKTRRKPPSSAPCTANLPTSTTWKA
jgi:hypothetical protein